LFILLYVNFIYGLAIFSYYFAVVLENPSLLYPFKQAYLVLQGLLFFVAVFVLGNALLRVVLPLIAYWIWATPICFGRSRNNLILLLANLGIVCTFYAFVLFSVVAAAVCSIPNVEVVLNFPETLVAMFTEESLHIYVKELLKKWSRN
jgi:hypothetical protein